MNLVAATFTATATYEYTSAEDYALTINGAENGAEPCTSVANADGSITIVCPDGTTATVPGDRPCSVAKVTDGSVSVVCPDETYVPLPGEESCTVVENADGSFRVECQDGSSVTMAAGGAASLSEGSSVIMPAGGQAILSGGGLVRVLSIEATGGPNANITLANLTIQDGWASRGAGLNVLAQAGDVTIKGCSFVNNRSETLGGEIAEGGGARVTKGEFGSGSAIIRNSYFESNQANHGAGLFVLAPSVTLEGNTFVDNHLTLGGYLLEGYFGAGAHVATTQGPVNVFDNSFKDNHAPMPAHGGGLYLNAVGFATTTVQDNTFSGNQIEEAGFGGGAYVSVIDAPLHLAANIFRDNSVASTDATGGGGGLYVRLFGSFADGTFVNNAFLGNKSGAAATAAWLESLDTTVNFINNTAVNNQVTLDPLPVVSSAVRMKAPTASIYNNIIWGNNASWDLALAEGTWWVNLFNNDIHSYIVPSTAALNRGENIDADPELSVFAGYYIGTDTSLVIDAGSNLAPALPLLD
ncbi:MAG: right-handed parallel beta-helix repeat-containing protein, partial [Gammaproteobacteria bacterium]|nr:right-handed parallel beta-helix repeat-containing protein [Gammaproteobacteria bacterium]